LLLGAVGDAVGYRNGKFEFCTDPEAIQAEIEAMGGPLAIIPDPSSGWMVSDDTVQHLATLQALVDCAGALPAKSPASSDAVEADMVAFNAVMTSMARHHVSSWSDMSGRAPGGTCGRGIDRLSAAGATWDTAVPFKNSSNAGCGSAMRAMALGAVFHKESDEELLVAIAAESGALSHHSVAGCAAAVVSAVGCALGVRGVPVGAWPAHITTTTLPLCSKYLETRGGGRGVPAAIIERHMATFSKSWEAAAASTPAGGAVMSRAVAESASARDARYRSLGHGWDAISSVFISWDALQAADGSWEKFLLYGAAHGGDSDSTAAIGGAWFGALYGFKGVPNSQSGVVEYHARMEAMAAVLASIASS
jgi:ADP-ribosylarginine hydrolase